MTTKIASLEASVATLTSLVTDLVGEVKKLKASPSSKGKAKASKKAKELSVSEAQIRALTADHFKTLKYSVVEKDSDGENLVKDNQYVLVDGAEYAWYRGLKGLEASMRKNGEISTEPNDKGRSQMDFAREILSEMVDGGFCKLGKAKAEVKA